MVKTSPSNAGGVGSIPGRGANVPHASQPKNQNIKQKQYCNKFNKDFKRMVHIKKKSLGKKKKKRKRNLGVNKPGHRLLCHLSHPLGHNLYILPPACFCHLSTSLSPR